MGKVKRNIESYKIIETLITDQPDDRGLRQIENHWPKLLV